MRKLFLLLFLVPFFGLAQFNPVAFYQYGSNTSVNIPLLDVYSGAKVAFSLRKINTSYTGKCLRVRRSLDDTEIDIDFKSNGKIDDVALLSFVGANNGYVVKWYDQSGNGLDAYQTINANQPRIVLSGIIEYVNKNYAIRFDKTLSHFMKCGLFSFTTASVFSVGTYLIGNNNARFFGMSPVGLVDTGSTSPCFTFSTSTIRSNARAINTLNGETNGNQIISQIVKTTQSEMYRNNVLVGSDYVITSSLCDPPAINIARTGDAGLTGTQADYMDGYIKELIFYDSDQDSNRLGIQYNLNNYYKTY